MSRIIVKNLPKKVKEEQIRKHFEPFGEITDLQLKYTTDGVFRRFAFIGFLNEGDAQRSIDKLDKSYIGTSKLVVEQCHDLNDPNRPRPWSKYAKEKEEKVQIQSETNKTTKQKKNKHENSQLVDAILGDLKGDDKFKEFVRNVDSMKHAEKIIWNDTIKKTEDDDENSESDDEEQNQQKLKKKSKVKQEKIQEKSDLTEVKTEKIKKARFLIKIRGIPYSSKEKDIRKFFSPISIVNCRLIHNRKTNALTGVCWIELENEEDMKKAMFKQKSIMTIGKTGENRYLELSSMIKNKELLDAQKDKAIKPLKNYQTINESIGETGVLFVRNLSYRATEEDLEKLFNPFGQITSIHMPIDSLSKQAKGFAHVTFMFPEHALRAFNQLDGHAFQGRLLHILPGKTQQHEQENATDSNKQVPTSIATSTENNWNTLFLSTNVVAEIMSERFGVDKSSVNESNKKNDSLAVRLAVGETQIVHETRQFLIDNGEQLDAFSQAFATAKRSKTIILVKNLPIRTFESDLRILFEKYGKLQKIILPPYGYCASVIFEHSQEARQAFKQLSFRKFKDNRPLYLEWAPVNAVSARVKETQETSEPVVEEKENEEQHDSDQETFTLFVKNLNFSTTDQDLQEYFSTIGPCRAYVARKKDMKHPGQLLSMGYGFVEYPSASLLDEALKQLQNTEFEGHQIELKRSERKTKSTEQPTSNKRKRQVEKEQRTSKILVKNIPFQANVKELRELFSVFGELKFVRMPKKIDDQRHRGFGFIDFVSKNDAKNAFEALCHSTHLYGRRLVLEWADEETETVEGLRRKTAAEFDLSSSSKKTKRSELMGDLRRLAVNGDVSEKKTSNDDDGEDEND